MALGQELMFAQLCLKLTGRIGPPKAKRRSITPGPQARPVRHDKERLAAGPKHPPCLLQQIIGPLGCLKPVQHDQLVHVPCLDGPERLFAQHRHVLGIGRPGHHPLRPGHKGDHTPRIRQIGTQQRQGKAEARHRLPLGLGPKLDHPATHGGLGRPPKRTAIIEVSQILHVEMHCRPLPFGLPHVTFALTYST